VSSKMHSSASEKTNLTAAIEMLRGLIPPA
jgi:hypothetical protein